MIKLHQLYSLQSGSSQYLKSYRTGPLPPDVSKGHTKDTTFSGESYTFKDIQSAYSKPHRLGCLDLVDFFGFGLVGLGLWHITRRLFIAKSSLYIYIKYIGFGRAGFYGISTIIGYLMPNPLQTYALNIYDL